MNLIKRLSLGLLVFLTSTSFVLWILAKTANPDTIKNLVTDQLSAISNKPSHIHGGISWHLFPVPGIKITDISLGDQPGTEDYSLSVSKLMLNLKLTPLVSGKLVFNDVNLDGVNILINANRFTWPNTTKNNRAKSNLDNSRAQFNIDRILISHAQIEINSQGQKTQIRNLKVGIEQFNTQNTPFSVQLKANINSKFSDHLFKTQISYNGHISLSEKVFNNAKAIPVIEGQIHLNNSQLNGLVIDSVNTNIRSNSKKIRFMPLTLSLYQGESIGDMYYDFSDKKLKLNQTANNLDGKSFMNDLFGQKSMQGNLDYSIQAELPLYNSSLENLHGKGSFTLKDGIIKKVNLGLFIEDLKNTLPTLIKTNNSSVKSDQFDMNKYNKGETAFNLINIQYQLHQAQLLTESFILQTNNLQITGGGNVNLKNQNIQSHLLLTLAGNEDSSFQNIQQILGGGFPILLEGTLSQPLLSANIKLLNTALTTVPIQLAMKQPMQTLKKHLLTTFN